MKTLLNLNSTHLLFNTEKFWTISETLSLIVINTTSEFLLLYSFIVLSLLATFFRNSIYKVLNLGVMSILVAGLWSYTTDLTFIYVVYILAFVGAVIMLFLSVILMLPSSAISSNRAAINILLLQSTDTFIFKFGSFFQLLTVVVIIFTILYFIYDIYVLLTKHTSRYFKKATSVVTLTVLDGTDSPVFGSLRQYIEKYNFYGHSLASDNALAFAKSQTLFDYSEINVVRERVLAHSLLGAEVSTPLVLLAVPKGFNDFKYSSASFLHAVMAVFYEFKKYYTYRIEPVFFKFLAFCAVHCGGSREQAGNFRSTKCSRIDDYLLNSTEYTILSVKDTSDRSIIIIRYIPWWSPFSFTKVALSSKLIKVIKFIYWHAANIVCNVNSWRTLASAVRSYIDYTIVYSRYLFNKTFLPTAPVNVIMYLYNNPKISAEFKALWFVHGVQYYIFKYIDAKLFANNARSYKLKHGYAQPAWFALEKFYYPKQPARDIKFSKFPHNLTPQIVMYYEPSGVLVAVDKFLLTTYAANFGVYKIGIDFYSRNYNRMLLLLNIIWFLIKNLVMNLIGVTALALNATISVVIEIAAQAITYISVFLLAVPVIFFKSPISLLEHGGPENLSAIQQGLYSSNPMLLLMSVTSLLVALIGAAVIFAKKKL